MAGHFVVVSELLAAGADRELAALDLGELKAAVATRRGRRRLAEVGVKTWQLRQRQRLADRLTVLELMAQNHFDDLSVELLLSGKLKRPLARGGEVFARLRSI